jgi:lysophospholipase L1-like esterase
MVPTGRRSKAAWLAPIIASLLGFAPVWAAPQLKPVGPDAIAANTQAVPLKLGGRALVQGSGFASGWPGVYAEAQFVGASVLIGPISGRSRWRVSIDGAGIGVLDTLVAPVFVIEGLSDEAHTLRLERIDEDRFAIIQIAGVYVPTSGRTAPPAPPKARQIEFIGDSFMSGFAMSSASFECTDQKIWESTDTSLAWPVIVAKALDADYQISAYSGAGFVRNFVYQRAWPAMPSLYERTVPAVAGLYRRPATWRPDLMIIGLGENDFEPPVLTTDTLPTVDAVRTAIVPAIARFVQRLRRENPAARIVLLDYGHLPSRAAHDAALARLSPADRRQVSLLTMDRNFGLTACYSHLDTADHRLVADRVLRWLSDRK